MVYVIYDIAVGFMISMSIRTQALSNGKNIITLYFKMPFNLEKKKLNLKLDLIRRLVCLDLYICMYIIEIYVLVII